MNITRLNLTSREYHSPIAIQRKGCPSQLTPTYKISATVAEDRRQLVHKFATMELAHLTKEGGVKNSLPLGKIHHEMEIESFPLHLSGASNILLSTISFDCLITKKSGESVRHYHFYNLKIPGTNTGKEVVFSYDTVVKAYGSKENLYAALRHFYLSGRHIANPENHCHGHEPDYDPSSPKHDQYIRHTEQLLVAYLALPQAALMLGNRLRAEIRGKHPDATAVKVYNMGLHLHSTKTCCGPCEYSLVGLMNKRDLLVQNELPLGFLHNFQQVCSIPNEQLTVTLPKKSLFQLLVTVTANDADAHHQKQPTYTIKKLAEHDPVPVYTIPVKNPITSQRIFTAMLDHEYDVRKLPLFPSLIDHTVGISGSKATPGSSGTIGKVWKVRNDEMLDLIETLALFRM